MQNRGDRSAFCIVVRQGQGAKESKGQPSAQDLTDELHWGHAGNTGARRQLLTVVV
jgi:hypothetical protein